MCLLTYFEPGVQPDVIALANGAVINDDGHGFAIVHGGQIIVHRGLLADQVIDTFEAARQRYPDGPAMFHSRMATHGETTVDNVHPFTVDGDARTVLAHNGILPTEVQPRKGDIRSDTAILAASMAGRFGSLRKPQVRASVTRWMGNFNKLVILTVNRRFGGNAFILNEEAGIWTPEGIWYSNDGYRTSGSRWQSSYWSYRDGEYATESTVVGKASKVDSVELCWMCGGDLDACTCYDPHAGVRLPRLPGEVACYGCKNPRMYCDCKTDQGSVRCPGCFYWIVNTDREMGVCSVCRVCLECDQSEADCDCYEPESAKRPAGTESALVRVNQASA
jgi:glutamine amidotransferase